MNVHLVARARAALLIALLIALLPMGTRGAPLTEDVNVESTNVNLAAPIVDAVRTRLAQRPAGVVTGTTSFRITSAAVQPSWALVSVVALDDPELDAHAPGAGGLSRLVLVQQQPNGVWQATIDGEPTFADLVATTPPALVAPDAKAILAADPALRGTSSTAGTSTFTVEPASTVNYKFPWPAGHAWGWWQGWHMNANDLGTTSADRRVLAAADGVVSSVYSCTLSTMIDLKHADGAVFRYIHLDKQSVDTSKIRVGARVPQGLVLGTVKPNTWSDGNCGYTQQSPNSAHIHWVMPTDRPVTLDGWTITFPTSAWRKDGVTKVPGYGAASTLLSTNVATTSTAPAASNFRHRVFLPVSR
jgi:hypothetical protein